jgi:peptidyl-prolyl cis-trans isomerase C
MSFPHSSPIFLSALTLTLLLTTPFRFTNAAESKSKNVIATVGNDQITVSEFNEKLKEYQNYLSDKKLTKRDILNEMINRKIGIAKGKAQKLNEDPIIKDKMEEVLYHATLSKELAPQLAKIEVSSDEVGNYYKANKEYRTATILFRVPINPTKEQLETAIKASLEVYNALKAAPQDFSQLANKFSQSSVAPNGGDVGFIPRVRLPPEYFEAIDGKSAGYITNPIRTQFGMQIVKILDVKALKDIDTELYKKIIYDEKKNLIFKNYFTAERSKFNAKIIERAL